MPMRRKDYPPTWKQISTRIRARAGDRCEWHEGGFRCQAVNRQRHPQTGSQVVLTVAHLCHDPSCTDEMHLLALCQLHHNSYDRPMRGKHAAQTRRRKKVEAGQLELIISTDSG